MPKRVYNTLTQNYMATSRHHFLKHRSHHSCVHSSFLINAGPFFPLENKKSSSFSSCFKKPTLYPLSFWIELISFPEYPPHTYINSLHTLYFKLLVNYECHVFLLQHTCICMGTFVSTMQCLYIMCLLFQLTDQYYTFHTYAFDKISKWEMAWNYLDVTYLFQ